MLNNEKRSYIPSAIKKLSIADIFTLANGLIGFLAITYIFDGKFLLASTLIICAIILDGLDGFMARRFGSKHSLGRYLDSLSDTISFCFAPSILIYAMYYDINKGTALTSFENALTVVASMFIVCFGIIRLARFAYKEYKFNEFIGVPTPVTAFLITALCLLFGEGNANTFSVQEQPYIVLPITIIISFLMISDVKYPKIRGKFDVICALGLILMLIPAFALIIVPARNLYTWVARFSTMLSLILISIYIIGGPIYVKWKKRSW